MPRRSTERANMPVTFNDCMIPAKRAMYVVGGVLWLLFSLGFGFILIDYVAGGAGLQFLGGPVSSGSVWLGIAHVTGFVAAIVSCFAIGAWLCARGLISYRGMGRINIEHRSSARATPNPVVERMRSSRSGQFPFGAPGRLARTAHHRRSGL